MVETRGQQMVAPENVHVSARYTSLERLVQTVSQHAGDVPSVRICKTRSPALDVYSIVLDISVSLTFFLCSAPYGVSNAPDIGPHSTLRLRLLFPNLCCTPTNADIARKTCHSLEIGSTPYVKPACHGRCNTLPRASTNHWLVVGQNALLPWQSKRDLANRLLLRGKDNHPT